MIIYLIHTVGKHRMCFKMDPDRLTHFRSRVCGDSVNCNDWDAICRMVGTSKNTAHILFLSITVQTDTSMCKHFERVPGTLFLHSPFYGLLEICVRLVKHASKAKHLVLLALVGESSLEPMDGQQRNNIDWVFQK